MCFEDDNVRNVLQNMLLAAIEVWHRDLGPRRGVQFVFTPREVCPPEGDLVGRALEVDTVVVQLTDTDASSTVGFLTRDRTYGRHILRLNPDKGRTNAETIAIFVHELG